MANSNTPIHHTPQRALAIRFIPPLLAMLLSLCLMSSAWAFERFVVQDIRVEGLQRIAAGTVFNYLPVKVGDTLDEALSATAIRVLFKTGFFKDVRLEREGDVLVVSVIERPSVANIDITGNKELDKDELLEGLKTVGLAEGRVFDRSLLDKVEQELHRLYFSRGKYGVKLESTVTPLERNRVGVSIAIAEGPVARIHEINILGNTNFKSKELLDEFDLTTPRLFSFYTGSDKYSRQKLSADLERLRSFYLDRGYINFKINSTQVSITPDKRDVYITINVSEGDQFTVSDVKLAGELVVPQEELFKLVTIQPGDIFSRKRAAETNRKIGQTLGNSGHAFSNVNVIPDINNEKREVALTFFVDPGKRVYVRRVNFSGNTRTRDEVLRREMRQLEGGWISTEQVERSRIRLQKLGYFEEVNVQTPAVPESPDQVDVNFGVTERPSGNLLLGAGYSQSDGIVLSANVTQNNFLGTGNRVSIAFNNSDISTRYRLAYTNPYYTLDGVSRGFDFLYTETDAGEANIGQYSSDLGAASVTFGLPISEFDSATVGTSLEKIKIHTSSSTPAEYRVFLDENGDEFAALKLVGGLSHDTRNRAIFADRGVYQNLSAELAFGELQFYKLTYRHIYYLALSKKLTLQFKGELGYGSGFGGTSDFPFFENYLAGGGRSVRGFKDNTLGPKDINGEPLGGNLKVVGHVELLFPLPFIKDSRAWRFAAFFDAGNVYDTDGDTDLGSLRYSVGVGLTWLSPFGALALSLAQPFNDEAGDETQTFQFSFGTGF